MTAVLTNLNEQLANAVEKASGDAAKIALIRLSALGEEEKRLIVSRRAELDIALELLTLQTLGQLSRRYLVFEENDLFKPVASRVLPMRTVAFNVRELYQTRPGIRVWDGLVDELELTDQPPIVWVPERPYISSQLKTRSYDKDARKQLPEMHLTPPEDVVVFPLAQPSGEKGLLLNDGKGNFFYVLAPRKNRVFTLRITRSPKVNEWTIAYWPAKDGWYMPRGSRIVCPGTLAA